MSVFNIVIAGWWTRGPAGFQGTGGRRPCQRHGCQTERGPWHGTARGSVISFAGSGAGKILTRCHAGERRHSDLLRTSLRLCAMSLPQAGRQARVQQGHHQPQHGGLRSGHVPGRCRGTDRRACADAHGLIAGHRQEAGNAKAVNMVMVGSVINTSPSMRLWWRESSGRFPGTKGRGKPESPRRKAPPA